VRDWLPPRFSRWSPWWLVASVALHAVVITLALMAPARVFPPAPVYVVLAPPGSANEIELPPYRPIGPLRAGAPQARRPVRPAGPRRAVPPPVAPDTVRSGIPPVPAAQSAAPPAAPPAVAEAAGETAADSLARAVEGLGVGPSRGVLGARFGDGRIWVRPWDAIAAAIAASGRDSITPAMHVALIDSAIVARVQAFLDTLAPDSFAVATPKPWTTEINGQKWGVDGSWIYLGGLKLPTAILALLPLPQGNYDAAKHNAELMQIRSDIIQAARRAESAAEFRKYVEETRKRHDAEREAKKNQRIPPDSIKTPLIP
jgi:hypothetical protein